MAPEPRRRCIIHYRDVRKQRWKYKLEEAYEYPTPFRPAQRLAEEHEFVCLETDGTLRLKQNYAWDGPSGPTIDSKSFMRASLVHDGIYQLFRLGLLDASEDRRELADGILYELCREDGMWPPRARWVHFFVRCFGARRARKQLRSEPICAP